MGHNHHIFHLPHLGRKEAGELTMPPKGCMAVRVGGEGEEPQRFVVPVMYLNHPLFLGLLKVAEEEYGFEHKGSIAIPCHVEYFRKVQDIISRDTGNDRGGSSHHHHHHHHHHHYPHLLTGCFRV